MLHWRLAVAHEAEIVAVPIYPSGGSPSLMVSLFASTLLSAHLHQIYALVVDGCTVALASYIVIGALWLQWVVLILVELRFIFMEA